MAISTTLVDADAAEGSEGGSAASDEKELEYETCYGVYVFSEVAGPVFRNVDGVFLEIYGGGPRGGYLISVNGNIYRVNQEWFEPFKLKLIEEGTKFAFKNEGYYTEFRMLSCDEEFVDEECEFDCEICAEMYEEQWEKAKQNYEEAHGCVSQDSGESSPKTPTVVEDADT
jgi:hypothetical protein